MFLFSFVSQSKWVRRSCMTQGTPNILNALPLFLIETPLSLPAVFILPCRVLSLEPFNSHTSRWHDLMHGLTWHSKCTKLLEVNWNPYLKLDVYIHTSWHFERRKTTIFQVTFLLFQFSLTYANRRVSGHSVWVAQSLPARRLPLIVVLRIFKYVRVLHKLQLCFMCFVFNYPFESMMLIDASGELLPSCA